MTFRPHVLYTTSVLIKNGAVPISSKKWTWFGCNGSNLRHKSTKDCLLKSMQPHVRSGSSKVTLVGVGQVGMACVFSIISQRISSEVCLVDKQENKLMGEMHDLQHGSLFLHDCKIDACTDYSKIDGSKICIIAAGARQREGESRLNLLQRNTDILKQIIPHVMEHAPDTILLIASNPVDIMTYVAWKLSGLPRERVIGSGTNLDSSRFRILLSQRLGIAPTSCHGWIIGEHGDSSVAVWSGVNIAGIRLREMNPKIGTEEDKEDWEDLHRKVVESAYHVIQLKGYTSWAIGMAVASIASSVIRNTGNLHAVSVAVQGIHGIKEDVFLSLPAVVAAKGVTDIVLQPLADQERAALQKSAQLMAQVQSTIKF